MSEELNGEEQEKHEQNYNSSGISIGNMKCRVGVLYCLVSE